MNAGRSFSDAMGEILTDIRNKPEYQNYLYYKQLAQFGTTNALKNHSMVSTGNGAYEIWDTNFTGIATNPNAQEHRETIASTIAQQRIENGGYSQYDNPEFVNAMLK